MARRRKRRDHIAKQPAVPPHAATAGRVQPYVRATIGMISVKTIRTSEGRVVLRQGERISEEILTEYQQDEILGEIVANAMPGKK